MNKDIDYIAEEIEDEYDGAIYLERIKHRNKMLIRWTKLGMQVIITKGDKR